MNAVISAPLRVGMAAFFNSLQVRYATETTAKATETTAFNFSKVRYAGRFENGRNYCEKS